MKLIKMIAAIMFAFMMVFSLSTNVKAVESGVNKNQGSIVIENAKNGETYKIYRILDLDSYEYSGENNEKKEGNYSYTLKQDGTDVKNANQWQNFVKRNADGTFDDRSDIQLIAAYKQCNGATIHPINGELYFNSNEKGQVFRLDLVDYF